jgi:hypothetical protein
LRDAEVAMGGGAGPAVASWLERYVLGTRGCWGSCQRQNLRVVGRESCDVSDVPSEGGTVRCGRRRQRSKVGDMPWGEMSVPTGSVLLVPVTMPVSRASGE